MAGGLARSGETRARQTRAGALAADAAQPLAHRFDPEAERRGRRWTDSKLVQLARILDARLLTNDANLCSFARVQGVGALNLSTSPARPPDAQCRRRGRAELTKEGREPHQAVGYLPEGTMIVVNQARDRIGQTVLVAISSVLQTSGGRLFFAELRH